MYTTHSNLPFINDYRTNIKDSADRCSDTMNDNIRFVAIENNRIEERNHSWLKIFNRHVFETVKQQHYIPCTSLTTLDSVTFQSPLCIIFLQVGMIVNARTMIVTSKHRNTFKFISPNNAIPAQFLSIMHHHHTHFETKAMKIFHQA